MAMCPYEAQTEPESTGGGPSGSDWKIPDRGEGAEPMDYSTLVWVPVETDIFLLSPPGQRPRQPGDHD